jgi:transcriptional regulator with XRE-family HTH domain
MATKTSKFGPGALVRNARNSKQLTQRDLGAMIGVKASHIAYIESEQRNPSLALLRRLADALGLNRQELLFLVHPEAKYLTQSPTPNGAGSKGDGWRQFSTNLPLLQRHRVTAEELKVLRMANSLKPIANPRDFLFILNSIRMASDGGG